MSRCDSPARSQLPPAEKPASQAHPASCRKTRRRSAGGCCSSQSRSRNRQPPSRSSSPCTITRSHPPHSGSWPPGAGEDCSESKRPHTDGLPAGRDDGPHRHGGEGQQLEAARGRPGPLRSDARASSSSCPRSAMTVAQSRSVTAPRRNRDASAPARTASGSNDATSGGCGPSAASTTQP